MKQYFLLFIFTLVSASYSIGCSCNYMGSFLKVAPGTPLVALVKVKKHLTSQDIYNTPIPLSMEVEIVDVYKGTETRKSVTVWGDPGHLCRPYLSAFEEGQYYVIAFIPAGYGEDEKETDYSISVCGAFCLSADIQTNTATGNINSKDRTISSINLVQLKKRLQASPSTQ